MNIFQGRFKLTHKTTVARDTLRLRFVWESCQTLTGEPVDPQSWTFKPGQFISLGFDTKTWRAYSIASPPNQAEIELVVRLVENGKGSIALKTMPVGETLEAKGPFGHFGLSDNPEALLVFCGTGTGIAPFRSMILAESQQKKPRPMHLLYGGRDTEDIAYLDEMPNWSTHLATHLGLSRDLSAAKNFPNARTARITTILQDKTWPETAEFYLCGNGPMVIDVQEALTDLGVGEDRIFGERFN